MGREARLKKFRPNIMVGMPIHNFQEPMTLACWENTAKYLPEHGISATLHLVIGNPYVDAARNTIVQAFLDHKEYTHLMWIDSDMVWNPESIEKLASYDVPVASALVTLKAPPFRVTLFEFALGADGDMNTFEVSIGRYPLDKPFKIPNTCIGTAFMLLKREVIEKMEPPYFTGFTTKSGRLKGTDLYFGARINRYGYDFLYDPTIRVYHVGRAIYGLEDHLAFLKLGDKQKTYVDTTPEDLAEYKRSFAGPSQELIAEKIKEMADADLSVPLPEVQQDN